MKRQAIRTIFLCGLFASLIACNNATLDRTGIDVAIIHASPDAQWPLEVAAKLSATSKVASTTVIDGAVTTPTLAELQRYDAVMIMTDNGLVDPTSLGNNMADYVDACGGVVQAMFSYNTPLTGRFATDNYFVIPSGTGQTQGTQQTLGTVHDPAHPIMAGVTSFDGGAVSYRPSAATLVAGSTLIAEWTDGMPLVTARTLANGAKRADLGFYPPSSDSRSDFWNPATDGVAMMVNALEWVATGCN